MATTIRVHGRITEQGQLEIELPEGLPAGDAQVTIELTLGEWSAEDLARAVKVEPTTGAEIVAAGLTGGWAEQGITDSAQWIEQARQRRGVPEW